MSIYVFIILSKKGASMLGNIINKVEELKEKVNKVIRDKALLRLKARLAQNGIDISELTQYELEVLLKDEEDKIWDDYKSKSIFGLAALLGISLW